MAPLLAPPRVTPNGTLSADSDEFLQHVITGRDDLGIGRIGPLGDDHVGKLLGQVNRGGLQGGGRDFTDSTLAAKIEQESARSVGLLVGVAV